MMPKCLLLLPLLLLGACMPDTPDMHLPPPLAPSAVLPSSAAHARPYSAARTHRTDEPRLRHFDAAGKPADKPVTGGYYRQLLGRNPQGERIVQDFYQDGQSPYTSPFVAAPDAKLNDFHGIYHSRTAWFAPNGDLRLIADYRNGRAQGTMWFFRNNKPALHIRTNGQQARQMQFLDENAQVSALAEQKGSSQTLTLFYRNGNAMLHIQDSPAHGSRHAWREDGQPVLPEQLAADIRAAAAQLRQTLADTGRTENSLLALLERTAPTRSPN